MAQQPKQFLIDSRDHDSGTTHSAHFTINPAIRNIKNIYLKAFSMPFVSFNIDTSNNTIYYNGGSCTITPGIYTSTTILPAIKAAIEGSGYAGTITATYSSLNYLITIAGTIAFSLEFSNLTNSAAYLLGFANVDLVAAVAQTGEAPAHLGYPEYFYVNINNQMNSRTTAGDTASFILFSQSISGQQDYFFQNTHYPLECNGALGTFQDITVQIFRRGMVPFLLRGADWSMLLEFEYTN